MANTALVWIRDDFRIQNNDALTYATNQHDVVTVSYTHLPLPPKA